MLKTFNWHALRSVLDGAYYVTVGAIPDEYLTYNIMAARHDFKRNVGDKDLLLDVANQWKIEAARRHLVIGPRRVLPWLDKDKAKTGHPRLIGVLFECPGCGEMHAVTTTAPNQLGAKWTWNGSYERPTITPTILRQDNGKTVCHVSVSDGNATFLGDCPHALSGSTIELPEC